MGFRFRKSIKIGPARVNISKSGIGYSVGTKGLRVTKKAGGGIRTTASIPGTGISYVKDSGKKSTAKSTKSATNKISNTSSGNGGCLKGFLWFLVVCIALALIREYWKIILAVAIVGVVAFIAFKIYRKNHPHTAGENAEEPNPSAHTENAMEPAAELAKPESEVKIYRVAGVEYYLDNLMSMMEPNYLYAYKKQELIDACRTNENVYKQTVNTDQLELVPEPTNPHDRNAIMVQLGGKLVGYIPAADCEHVLEIIRDDRIISLTCQVEGGKYKMVDEDYDCMKDKSTYRMETGEDPYGITVYIREKL